jgi:hypothetical protein
VERPKAKTERDRFIPVSRYGLRAKLVAMLTEGSADAERDWGRALDCLATWRHQDYRKRLLDLLEDYLPFTPDSDTVSLVEHDEAGRDKARREFIEGVESLLVQANYVRLSESDLQRILVERSPHGLSLKVDLSDFDDLLLYYRGTSVETREERNPWRFYATKDRYDVPIFERLFLLLKLKPTETRAATARCAWRATGGSTCRSACRAASSTSKCSSASRRSTSRCCFPTPRSPSGPSTS